MINWYMQTQALKDIQSFEWQGKGFSKSSNYLELWKKLWNIDSFPGSSDKWKKISWNTLLSYFNIKGAPKLYFMHYSCVVIIFFSLFFWKTSFSSFCVPCFSFVLFWIRCHPCMLYSICMIMVYTVSARCSVILFSFYKN